MNVRTYQVAYCASILAIILCTNKKVLLWKVKTLVLGLIVIAVFLGVNSKLNIIDIREVSSGNDGEKNIQSISSGRSKFWKDYYIYIKNQQPFLIIYGNGLGSTLEIMQGIGFNIGAHNDFLQIMGEYGVVGLVSYLILLAYITCNILKKKNYEYGLAIIIAWIISAFVNGSIYYTFSMILVIFSLCSELENDCLEKSEVKL